MFLFPAAELLLEMEIHAPDIVQQCRLAFERISPDLDFLRIPDAEFAACRSESIDYALMEKTSRAAVVPLMLAGTIWAPGSRCGTSVRKMRLATWFRVRSR